LISPSTELMPDLSKNWRYL